MRLGTHIRSKPTGILDEYYCRSAGQGGYGFNQWRSADAGSLDTTFHDTRLERTPQAGFAAMGGRGEQTEQPAQAIVSWEATALLYIIGSSN